MTIVFRCRIHPSSRTWSLLNGWRPSPVVAWVHRKRRKLLWRQRRVWKHGIVRIGIVLFRKDSVGLFNRIENDLRALLKQRRSVAALTNDSQTPQPLAVRHGVLVRIASESARSCRGALRRSTGRLRLHLVQNQPAETNVAAKGVPHDNLRQLLPVRRSVLEGTVQLVSHQLAERRPESRQRGRIGRVDLRDSLATALWRAPRVCSSAYDHAAMIGPKQRTPGAVFLNHRGFQSPADRDFAAPRSSPHPRAVQCTGLRSGPTGPSSRVIPKGRNTTIQERR